VCERERERDEALECETVGLVVEVSGMGVSVREREVVVWGCTGSVVEGMYVVCEREGVFVCMGVRVCERE